MQPIIKHNYVLIRDICRPDKTLKCKVYATNFHHQSPSFSSSFFHLLNINTSKTTGSWRWRRRRERRQPHDPNSNRGGIILGHQHRLTSPGQIPRAQPSQHWPANHSRSRSGWNPICWCPGCYGEYERYEAHLYRS